MIGHTYRFHGPNALSYAFRHGKQVRGAHLSLRYALNARRETYRIAVVVSRKVDKSAVVRNRIRRRIYEASREYCQTLTQPYDMVFVAYSNQLAELPAPKLRDAVHGLLQKSGIPLSAGVPPHAIVNPKEAKE